jgi:hypothetical protein
MVSCFYNGKAEEVQCYLFNEGYRISKDRFVNREFIKEIIRIHDSERIKI